MPLPSQPCLYTKCAAGHRHPPPFLYPGELDSKCFLSFRSSSKRVGWGCCEATVHGDLGSEGLGLDSLGCGQLLPSAWIV